MNKKITAFTLFATFLLITLGYLIPIGSYTTTQGCTLDNKPTQRLSLLKGQNIDEIKKQDIPPLSNMGCSINTKYTLYII